MADAASSDCHCLLVSGQVGVSRRKPENISQTVPQPPNKTKLAHLHGADGVKDDWAGVHVEGDVHAWERCEDVGEKHDTVGLECMPRLEGDLNLGGTYRRHEGGETCLPLPA